MANRLDLKGIATVLVGVQQARRSDRITFSSITGWPGEYICAEGITRTRTARGVRGQ